MMGNLRNLDLTETVLNSIDSFIFEKEKANLFFYNQLRYIPFFLSDS